MKGRVQVTEKYPALNTLSLFRKAMDNKQVLIVDGGQGAKQEKTELNCYSFIQIFVSSSLSIQTHQGSC